jgi:hypothetical protein
MGQQNKSRGLGDTIDNITTKTGIKKAVKTVTSSMGIEDCGCNKRKKVLNNPNLIVNKIFYKAK